MNKYDGWDGILEDGETILWQGRPSKRFRLKLSLIPMALFGLAFSGFALFWMVMASAAGGFFWMFGLIHFSVGIGIGVVPVFLDNFTRRHTWYTLTKRRAFIASDLPLVGRRLKSYPINASTHLTLEERPLPNLYFAEEFRRTKNGSRRIDIGFEAIAEAKEVLAKMRTIQEDAV